MSGRRYKDVKISEILKAMPIKNKITVSNLNEGNIPVYSSETSNNGIRGYYNKEEFLASKDNPLIVFGDHTRSVNVATENFAVMDNVKVLKKKNSDDLISLWYIKYVWEKIIPNLRIFKTLENSKRDVY